jgi:hypothetical protein
MGMTTALGPTNSKPRAAKATRVTSDGQSPGLDRSIPLDVDSELTLKTRAFVLQQFDRIDELTKRLEKREAKPAPKPTPQNSSLPPSTVHPHSKPKSKKPKSQLKRGGQHGHKRHTRPLIATEQAIRFSNSCLLSAAVASKH